MASVCGCATASGRVWMGAQGTPAASRRSIHSPLERVMRIASISARSSGLLATRAALVAKRGSVAHSGWPSDLRQLGEEPVVAGGDDERSRLRLEALERHDALAARPVALRHLARGAEGREVALEPGEPGLEERGVHHAAAPRLLALDEPGQRAHRRPHAGAVVEDGGADAGGRPALVAVHHHEAGEGLHHGLVAGLELERARAPEGPHRAVDEPRVARRAARRRRAPSPRASRAAGSGRARRRGR